MDVERSSVAPGGSSPAACVINIEQCEMKWNDKPMKHVGLLDSYQRSVFHVQLDASASLVARASSVTRIDPEPVRITRASVRSLAETLRHAGNRLLDEGEGGTMIGACSICSLRSTSELPVDEREAFRARSFFETDECHFSFAIRTCQREFGIFFN